MAQILLIEPDTLVAQSYGNALKQAGHEVVWCITAHAAITAADTKKPDAVVLEPQLAGPGGLEFLYEFRSYPEWDHIPVLLLTYLTDHDLTGLRAAGRELGIVEYMQKSRTTLRDLIRSVNVRLQAAA